jgi:mono/diheme cytochrome c family protein
MKRQTNKENYSRYLMIGVIGTLLLLAGLSIYWISEPERLTQAAETLAEERISQGRKIYNDQCSACHGSQGEGGIGPALNDKTLLKNTPDQILFSLTRSGIPNTQMPAWSVEFGGPLTDEDVRNVVAFIRAWEPNAPEIKPVVFEPSAERGALLFASTCSICHGEGGLGGGSGPALNDAQRLAALDNDWYRAVIKNGRPAKGMPTWGTVLSPNQIEDLVALVDTWRQGSSVEAAFNITELLASAVYSLQEQDPESAILHVNRALTVAVGPGAEVLRNSQAQLTAGDAVGALATLEALQQQWPLGDATLGAATYSTYCAPCHGATGEGGIGVQLNPNEFIQNNNNADLVAFLAKGRPGTAMAGFAGRLTDDDLANIATFLRLWQPAP